MAQSPTPGQINAYNGAQGTGVGVIYDALGKAHIVGANMPAGAGSGNVLSSDASGNLSLGPLGAASLPAATTSTQGAVVFDGTAADIQQVGIAASAGAVGKAADAGHVHASSVYLPADQGLLAWNYDMGATVGGGNTPLATGGLLYTMSVPLRAAASVTNIVIALLANGSVLTSNQCFAALYAGFGGALIAQTADQSAAWGAGAVKIVTMALSGGPYTVQAGTPVIAVWFNGTTGPAFFKTQGNTVLANGLLAAAASRWGTANSSITTTAPSTLGTVSATSNGYWAALG